MKPYSNGGSVPAFAAGWQGPTIIIIYFFVSAVITHLVASPVAALTARVQAAEGDFRAMHSTLLHSSEATAMCSDGSTEDFALDEAFGVLLFVRWRLIARQGLLTLSTTAVQYFGTIVNYIAIGIVLCSGVYHELSPDETASIVSRGSTFALTMVYGLTQLVGAAGAIAELSGHTRRVAALFRGLSHVETATSTWQSQELADEGGDGGKRRRWRTAEGTALLTCRHLSVSLHPAVHAMCDASAAPASLLSGVKLEVHAKSAVLVRGNAGVGKTALLRTICGVWPMGRADSLKELELSQLMCIPPLWDSQERIAGAPVFLVLPQAAPLRPGLHTSLLEQLAYPLLDTKMVTDELARDALAAVGQTDLLRKLGGLHKQHSPQEWSAALSPGQRQLLVCARIFVHTPALVLLDEATSAVPSADEARIYERLRDLGIAFVSIGHRDSLDAHHDQIINLNLLAVSQTQ